MPRVQAEDYDNKRWAIMDAAARRFAQDGYTGTRLEQVAADCGASKSMLYHYFGTKEALLFEILQEHLEFLADAMQAQTVVPERPQDGFEAFVGKYMQLAAQTRRRQVVALNEVKYLSDDNKTRVLALERRMLEIFRNMLKNVNPRLPVGAYRPYAMMLIGMLNWTELWYKPNGEIKQDELITRLSALFLNGFLKAQGEQ